MVKVVRRNRSCRDIEVQAHAAWHVVHICIRPVPGNVRGREHRGGSRRTAAGDPRPNGLRG